MTPLDEGDHMISILAESAARKVNRRESLFRFAKGTAGAVAAISIGKLAKVSDAFAATCTCGPSHYCSYYGVSCGAGGGNASSYCPSGHLACTPSRCGASVCPYTSAQWVSCTGCAQGSGSYRVCTDCIYPSCSPHCICLSACLCTGCSSAAEMLEDMSSRGIALTG